MSDYKVLDTYPVHYGNVMDFCESEILLPDGKKTHWDLIRHPGGAAVLPVDKQENLILVRQYRLGAGRELLEIPAGKADAGEEPIRVAAREMEEEIGMVAGKMEYLFDFYPAPAYSEEKTAIFLARDLIATDVNRDGDEWLHIETVNAKDALSRIQNGTIVDGKTIAAILAYFQLKIKRTDS